MITQLEGAIMIVSKSKFWILLSVLVMLGLGACKVDMTQEIWLNADNSGKALLEARVSLPRFSEEDTAPANMDSENVFQDFADRVKANPGAEITSYEITTDHSSDEYVYNYSLEFTYDKLQTLRNVICEDSLKGFNLERTNKQKLLTTDLRNFLMQKESDMQEYLGLLDIDMVFRLHLPSEPVKVQSEAKYNQTKNEIDWTFKLDDNWYRKAKMPVQVQF